MMRSMAKRGIPEPDFLTKLGARISALRRKHGWTQVMLAEIVGFHRSFIAELETGRRNISILNLHAIAKALGTSLSRLLSGL
jgi:transcriptional regulator with XRE-family HTH domain